MSDNGDKDNIEAIPQEYVWWEQRAKRLAERKQQLSLPIIDRTIQMIRDSCKEQQERDRHEHFVQKFKKVCESLEEAEDNMKFLNGIKRQVEVCSKSSNIDVIKATIPKVLKCLRSAWTLSKYYNTDENIISLLQKITNILLIRVKSLVNLSELGDPESTLLKAASSVSLLSEWEHAFHDTRLAIERSGREARWEFGVQDLFRPVHHIKSVCHDVMRVSRALRGTAACFSTALAEATHNQTRLLEANSTLRDLTASFASLQYDVFSESTLHHWQNHLSWFDREGRFLEVASVGVLDDVFEALVSSQEALEAVAEMIRRPERNAQIWKVVIASMPKVVEQFTREVKESTKDFQENCRSPPIHGDLPPISGSIYWAREIKEKLASTMEAMRTVKESIRQMESKGEEEEKEEEEDEDKDDLWQDAVSLYESFCGELTAYTHRQYGEWCARVSDILAQNLTRPLLTVSADAAVPSLLRYHVNFTSDLSDTLAEVRHLEALGFEVPEVARNMSVQKARLTNVAAALEEMLRSYHGCVDSLEGAEVGLLRGQTELVTRALSSGHLRLTWNNQAIQESCLDIGRVKISVFEYKIQQVHLIKKDIHRAIESVQEGCLIR